MNPQSNVMTLALFIFMIGSSAIVCQKDRMKELSNVHIEFASELVSHGILHKFDDFFEDLENHSNSDQYNHSDEIDEDEDSYEEEEYEDYLEAEEELSTLIDQTESKEELNEEYKKFVYKLCLLTAVSKETTIYATETIRV